MFENISTPEFLRLLANWLETPEGREYRGGQPGDVSKIFELASNQQNDQSDRS